MAFYSLAFLSGLLFLNCFSQLPSLPVLVAMTLMGLLSLIVSFDSRFQRMRLISVGVIGFLYGIVYIHMALSWSLPQAMEGKTLHVKGIIASIPFASPGGLSFLCAVKSIQSDQITQPAHGLIRLTWRDAVHTIHAGEMWRLTVRLKHIHKTMNPGSDDSEAIAFQQGIRAEGYVLKSDDNQKLTDSGFFSFLNHWREELAQKIQTSVSNQAMASWLMALAVGERQGLSPIQWEILRNTGTNHLMAIAGLHIGCIAFYCYQVVQWIWRYFPTAMYVMPAQEAGQLAAVVASISYSAMAGFLLPTQRACWMCVIVFATTLQRRLVSSWQVWSIALWMVLIGNPLNSLSPSAWLSFGSVALIIYGLCGRLHPSSFWWKWGRIQWILSIGLIPFSIGFFHQYSLISLIANIIAIPWMIILVIPWVLAGCLSFLCSNTLASLFLTFAGDMFNLLWHYLSFLSHQSFAIWPLVVPDAWRWMLAVVAVVILLLPIGFPGKGYGWIGLLPLICYHPLRPAVGAVWLTLLDVGQGLSAVIQTKHHILIFDAGPKSYYSEGSGERIVIPYLHILKITHIDRVMISHGDNDHIGGAEAILRAFPVERIETSVPERLSPFPAHYCLRGEHWEWDHVTFNVLYPSLRDLHQGNNSSCVLRVSTGRYSILLTGDIEKEAEKVLLSEDEGSLASTVLVAPHHGSKTSALPAFVKSVHPQVVLYPIGYRNRYHFPHVSVVRQYRAIGAVQYDTAAMGAIEYHFDPVSQDLIVPFVLYRLSSRHYWTDQGMVFND